MENLCLQKQCDHDFNLLPLLFMTTFTVRGVVPK